MLGQVLEDGGDVLRRIRDGVLHGQDLEQVAPVHRHEQALGQLNAELVLQRVRLVLLREDEVLRLFQPLLIAGHQGLEETRDLGDTFDDNTHVRLDGFEWRLAKQRTNRV